MAMHAMYPKLSIEADFPDGIVTWVPFISEDGIVGYHVYRLDAAEPTETYVYLLPSSGGEEGAADVFIYIGETGDPQRDEPVHWYEPFTRGEGQP